MARLLNFSLYLYCMRITRSVFYCCVAWNKLLTRRTRALRAARAARHPRNLSSHRNAIIHGVGSSCQRAAAYRHGQCGL